MPNDKTARINPFLRKQPWCFRGLNDAGRKLCFCGCGQPVGPKRSSSAGLECVKTWRAHSDLNHIRFQVEGRDKGVCAICHTDTFALKAAWGQEIYAAYKQRFGDRAGFVGDGLHLIYALGSDHPSAPKGFPPKDRRWWEADHIVPVSEGGGGCDFSGYRTLCIPCHKTETKKLAARLAAARKKTA